MTLMTLHAPHYIILPTPVKDFLTSLGTSVLSQAVLLVFL